MPELRDVARHFDTTPIYDAYDASYLFMGQFSTFNESGPDGSTSKRRILSLDPILQKPARSVVSVLGETWLIADGLQDMFGNYAIRKTYWTKQATDYASLYTPANLLLGNPPVLSYVHRVNQKYTVTASSSNYDPFWMVYAATTEPLVKGTILTIGSVYLRTRTCVPSPEGLLLGSCDELSMGPPVSGVFQTGAYDPVTDSYAAGSVTTPVLFVDPAQFFNYATEADPKYVPGDRVILVAKTALATPTAGLRVSADDRTWTVFSVQSELDAWALHVKP